MDGPVETSDCSFANFSRKRRHITVQAGIPATHSHPSDAPLEMPVSLHRPHHQARGFRRHDSLALSHSPVLAPNSPFIPCTKSEEVL